VNLGKIDGGAFFFSNNTFFIRGKDTLTLSRFWVWALLLPTCGG
jgi:hypothetical protein